MALKHPGEHQAEHVGGGVAGPAPDGALEFRVAPEGLGVLAHQARVQVKRYVKLLKRVPERSELGLVEVSAVGGTIDQHPHKAKLLHTTLELAASGLHILQSHTSEAPKPCRCQRRACVQKIIRPVGKIHRMGCIPDGLNPRCCLGQHGHGDPGLVHHAEALFG